MINSLKKLKVHKLTLFGPACNPPATGLVVVAFDESKVTCKGCLKGHGVRPKRAAKAQKGK